MNKNTLKILGSVLMIVWPIIKSVVAQYGIDLPDVGGLGDFLEIPSQGIGTIALLSAHPPGSPAAKK